MNKMFDGRSFDTGIPSRTRRNEWIKTRMDKSVVKTDRELDRKINEETGRDQRDGISGN